MPKAESKPVVVTPAAVPAALLPFYDALPAVALDPGAAIDRPEAVVRMLVLDAIRLFVRLTGRPPREIHVPPSLEAALQVDRGRNLGGHEKDVGPLRGMSSLFTCRPVWDAAEFRIE